MKRTPWPDVMLSRLKWYRRLRAGRWYKVWDLPFVQGGFEIWTRSLLPDIPGKVLAFEDYDAGEFRSDLNILKREFGGVHG